MYYLPTSCLVLFFLFSLLHHLSCASSEKESGWCQAQFQCGNITAGFPFSGGNRPQLCGHPSLELHCFGNRSSIIISNHLYNVLDIDKTSNTLRIARAELQGSLCNATFTAATIHPKIFELLPAYKSLTVLYLCNRNLSYLSSHICPGRGPISLSQNPDYQNSCQGSFTINVPKSYVPEEKELNLSQLESVLKEGFELKVKIDEKACQECLSTQGTCGFKNTTQSCCKEVSSSLICNTLQPPNATDLHKRCSAPFRCGDQRNLSYPFWISDRKECGHPKFKVDCGGGVAEISISSVKFRILEANYISGIIRLARSDFINNTCPSYPKDESFDEDVLPFAPNTEMLTIYYDCDLNFTPSLSTFGEKLDCSDDDTDGKTNYYVTRNISFTLPQPIIGQLNDLRENCSNVSIPANGPALTRLQGTPSSDNLEKALTEGFVLGLNQECLKCIESSGACGYSLTSNRFACYSIEDPQNLNRNKSQSNVAKAGIGAASALMGVVLIAAVLFSCKRKTSANLRQQNLKTLIPLKHYSYAQVQRITKSFAEVIGKGGFGTVYRGTLADGRCVAVKILKDSKGNGEDFINEVASMSQTSHVNIVTLLGFCSEGSKRAILYEFMKNGSLDKFISSERSSNVNSKKLYEIALGVARGLEYLHHGCRTRIVHFDIKPQNVLLDDNLFPKVSDFGLAKLCEKKESILSLLDTRGTIGYIAPEVFSRMYGRVSHKSDVYSYGMLVLEMIGARNKERTDQNSASNTSSMYFPEWIYKDLEKGDRLGVSIEEEELLKKMTLVGLWCIQPSPSERPAMNRVVEMMEGSVDALEIPPRPVFPAAPLRESSTLSEDISVSIEV